jgi:PAS domain S-box-containing protein
VAVRKVSWLSSLPIPALVALAVTAFYQARPSAVFDPSWLFAACSFILVTLVACVVTVVAFRVFLASGRGRFVLLGIGVLSLGVGALQASIARLAHAEAGVALTLLDISMLQAVVFHAAAVIITTAGTTIEVPQGRRRPYLVMTYVFVAALAAFWTLSVVTKVVATFAVHGASVHKVVMTVAGALALCAAMSLFASFQRTASRFLYWYGCAMACTAVSVTARILRGGPGSLFDWAGRLSLYAVGGYFLVLLLAAWRAARQAGVPLEDIMWTFFCHDERGFGHLSDALPDVIRRFDRDRRHVNINDACLRLYDRKAVVVLGRTMEEAGLPEDRAREWRKRLEEAFATGARLEFEERWHSSGGAITLQTTCVPETGPGGTIRSVLAISRDVTERGVLEAARRESETRYRSLFENMKDEVHLWKPVNDAAGRPVDLALVDMNAAGLKAWGKTLEEMKGRTAGELLGPEVIEPYRALMASILEEGRPLTSRTLIEVRGRFMRCTTVPVGGYLLVTATDLTELRNAQEGIRASEERLRMAANAAGFGTFVAYLTTGKQDWSPEIFELLEIDTSETDENKLALILGRIHPEDEEMCKQSWNRLIDPQGDGKVDFAFRLVRQDGGPRWLNVKGRVEFDGEGAERRPVRLLGTVVDITGRRQAERRVSYNAEVLAGVNDVLSATLSCDSEKGLGAACLQVALRITGSPTGFIAMQIPRGLRLVAMQGPDGETASTFESFGLQGFMPGATTAGTLSALFRNGRSIITNTAPRHPRWEVPTGRHPVVRALLAVPLVHDGLIRGLVVTANREGGYQPDHLQALEALAPALSEAFQHLGIQERLRQAHETLEAEVEERTAALEERTAQLRRLVLEISRFENRERRRLSRQLHDHLQQVLAAAKMLIQNVSARTTREMRETHLSRAAELMDECLSVSRSLSLELSPPILHEQGLVAAVRWLARSMEEGYGLAVNLDADLEVLPDPEGVSLLVYECTRELLLNVAHHAGVGSAELSMRWEADRLLELVVADRGAGFDMVELKTEKPEDALGLLGIRERITSLGGTADIQSVRGLGTRVRLLIPFPPEPAGG